MHRHLEFAALLVAATGACAGAPSQLHCSGQSEGGRPPPQRIELYTSEGCSSCPPAERWLATLEAAPASAWLPLAFHVDYWDALGWPDRFADRRYTARQQQVARRVRAVVYTPGVFVDGVEWRGWRAQELPQAGERRAARGALSLQADLDLAKRQLHWTTMDAPVAGHARWLALVQSGLRTEVRAGENAGSELQHGHVVRWLADIGGSTQGDATLPDDLDWRYAALVTWVEDTPGGATLAALRLPLVACTTH